MIARPINIFFFGCLYHSEIYKVIASTLIQGECYSAGDFGHLVLSGIQIGPLGFKIRTCSSATITVPGGSNQETGIPLFRNQIAFNAFAISDAISLFSAATLLLFIFNPLLMSSLEKLPFKLQAGSFLRLAKMNSPEWTYALIGKITRESNTSRGETVGNMRSVVAFNSESEILNLFTKSLDGLLRRCFWKGRIAGIGFGVAQFLLYASYTLGLWYASWLVKHRISDLSKTIWVCMVLIVSVNGAAKTLTLASDLLRVDGR
ncbi:ABC transporter B family member 1 [Tanacetum coccineum]